MQLSIPEYGNYYHFITESAMGLYRELRDSDRLASKECELWYKGKFASIVQLFSCRPIHVVENTAEIPAEVRPLVYIRPKNIGQWSELLSLRDYLAGMFPAHRQQAGITVIKRVGKREYAEHSELVSSLKSFNMPVREAVMELLPFKEQISLMQDTVVLIGPHGAGHTNMLFMAPGSTVVELYPKGFTDRCMMGMANAFGHDYIDIESGNPSVLGRRPSERVQRYLDTNPWPTRNDFWKWKPDRMELGRVLRDVTSFSIDPKIVMSCVDEICNRY